LRAIIATDIWVFHHRLDGEGATEQQRVFITLAETWLKDWPQKPKAREAVTELGFIKFFTKSHY
jgi:hypothetical protein